MGQDWRPDQAVTSEIMLALLAQLDALIIISPDPHTTYTLTMAGAFYAVSYVLSLRGPKGLLLDLEGLLEERNRDPSQYIVVALWGKIKGEHHERSHLLPSVNLTGSGIEVRRWIDQAVLLAQSSGRSRGPLMLDKLGKKITSAKLNEIFHEALISLFRTREVEFPSVIKTEEDIREQFNIFRSMRRGSDTRAHEEQVPESDINIINRWKAERKAGTRQPGLSMPQMYTDPALLLKPFLWYTVAM